MYGDSVRHNQMVRFMNVLQFVLGGAEIYRHYRWLMTKDVNIKNVLITSDFSPRSIVT
jgi:hypothetical protein